MKCIIIDNDRYNLEQCKHVVMQVRGFQTKLFNNSSEALTHIRENNTVDLIILDISLDCCDPKEFIRTVNKIRGEKSPDIMICSDRNDSDTILDYIGLGVVGYVVKPYDHHVLQRQLRVIRSRLHPDDIPANEMWLFHATKKEEESLAEEDIEVVATPKNSENA